MEIGKKYELVPRLIKAFIKHSPMNNANMVDIIQENGGWFEVKSMNSFDGEDFVSEIACANGKIFSADEIGDLYFELTEEEFYCFREYQEPEVSKAGVTQIHCIVDASNVDQIIELLQKTFK